jgi:hypothetical protein
MSQAKLFVSIKPLASASDRCSAAATSIKSPMMGTPDRLIGLSE